MGLTKRKKKEAYEETRNTPEFSEKVQAVNERTGHGLKKEGMRIENECGNSS